MDNKKLFVFLLLGVFMISIASALDFDNWVNYENNDMKVTITNAFNFGEDLGTAELKSHKTVNEILEVAPGEDKIVMYYDFNFKEVYENGLGEVEFINMSDGENIEKDYDFVTWDKIYEERNNYSIICDDVYSETNNSHYEVCESIIIGTYIEEIDGWVKLDTQDIPKGNVSIGLRTSVNSGDYIDGVWTIAGKKIKKHSEWTADLNVDLLAYFKLDDNLATTNTINNVGTNWTASANTDDLYTPSGKINSAFDFVATSSEEVISPTTSFLNGENAFSISVWIKPDIVDDWKGIVMTRGGSQTNGIHLANNDNIRVEAGGAFLDSAVGSIVIGNWYHIVVTYDGTTRRGYINNTEFGNSSGTDNLVVDDEWYIGFDDFGGRYWDGIIDEIGIWNRSLSTDEITQLYNNGDGISYTDVFGIFPSVTLISPADNVNITNPNIVFNTTVTDDQQVVNVTLYIDGVAEETNSSGFNGTYIFTKTLSKGIHNWSILAWNNQSLSNQSETRTFNITTGIEITLNKPDNATLQSETLVEFNWTIIPTGLNTTNWTLTVWFTNGTIAHQHINTTINTNESVDVIHNDTLFFDESYVWNVESCGVDGLTICDLSENRTFTIDTIPPIVNITYPPEGFIVTTPQENITLNYTIEHDTPVANCFYNTTFNSTLINISCTTNTTSLLYPNTDPDNLTIYVFGNDSASNIGVDNVTIFKDSTSPQIQFVPLTTESGSLLQDYIVANITATDDQLNTTMIYLYNSSGVLINSTSGSTSPLFINFTNLEEGTYFLNATANDSFGNINTTETRTIILLEIISWGGFIGDEYQLILFADSINEGGLEINNVTVEEIRTGVWKINTTESDNDLSRANIMQTLFDGTTGTDPRATSTYITNPTTVFSNNKQDDGKIGYLYRTTGNRDSYSVAGNITSIDNNNVTMWVYSRCITTGNGCGPINFYMPQGVVVKNFPDTTNSRTTKYIGTTTSDSYLNPVNFSMMGGDISVGTSTEERILILSKGNIDFDFQIITSAGSHSNSSTNFLDDEGFPELTYPEGTIDLNSPTEGEALSSQQVQFNCSAQIDDGTNVSNMTLYTNETGSWGARNSTTGLSDKTSTQVWGRTLPDAGGYIWNCQACDSSGVCGFYIFNKTFSVDSQSPSIIIESPMGTIGYGAVGLNETLNVTFTDVNLDSCWYNYNGTNITIEGCLTGVKNSTQFILEENNLNMTVYANDTLGNENSTFITWDYTLLEKSITYDLNVTEGETNQISIEVIISDSSSITNSTLNYGDINYTTSVFYDGENYTIVSSNIAPIVSSDTNYSFYFIISVDDVDYETTINNQTVLNADFSICGGISNDTLLNMSLFDEETLSNITGNIEFNADIISKSSGESVESINRSFNDVHFGAICFSPVSSYSLYYLNAEIRYFKDEYATEFYYIQKADLAEYPINLSLFDLSLNDSTEFSVTYKNNDFIFTEDAVIQLQRKYIGRNIYEVVEAPLTGDGGKATLHIDLNTNRYRASVVKEGELLDFFDNIVFSCENELSGDCTHSLDGTVNPNNDIPIEEITDFSYSISVDEDNQTITVAFAVPSGTSSTINVALEQTDMFGNLTSCNTTIITSAGSITCDYTDTIEKSILELSISKNDVQLAVLSYVNDPDLDMDGMNFFIVFLFMISLVGMAIASPEWMIIISVMVLIISGTMLLLKGMSLVMGLGAIAWVIIAAAIIILKMAKQEDR